MKRKEVDQLLETAIKLVEKCLERNGKVSGKYESAISAFGGAMNQTGSLPTCAMYLNSSVEYRSDIVRVLMNLVQKTGGFETINLLRNNENNQFLAQIIDEYERDQILFHERLTLAVIALKLALRTFNLDKEQT